MSATNSIQSAVNGLLLLQDPVSNSIQPTIKKIKFENLLLDTFAETKCFSYTREAPPLADTPETSPIATEETLPAINASETSPLPTDTPETSPLSTDTSETSSPLFTPETSPQTSPRATNLKKKKMPLTAVIAHLHMQAFLPQGNLTLFGKKIYN